MPTCEVGTGAKDWMESSLHKAISKIEKSLGVAMDKFVASHFETEDKYISTCGVGTEVIELNTRL